MIHTKLVHSTHTLIQHPFFCITFLFFIFYFILSFHLVTPMSSQKLLRTSAVYPRLRRPLIVGMRGSSHPLTFPALTSFSSLRLDSTWNTQKKNIKNAQFWRNGDFGIWDRDVAAFRQDLPKTSSGFCLFLLERPFFKEWSALDVYVYWFRRQSLSLSGTWGIRRKKRWKKKHPTDVTAVAIARKCSCTAVIRRKCDA